MATNYESIARHYDKDRTHFHTSRDEVLAGAIGALDGATVLDVGCGTGLWIQNQKRYFANATFIGAEPSDAMRGVASEKLNDHELFGASAESLPFPDHSFDFAATHFSFHHFRDKEQGLAEILRVLKKTGTLKVMNLCPERSDDWWLYDYFPQAKENDTKRFWTLDRITQALETAGWIPHADFQVKEQLSAQRILEEAELRVTSQLADLQDKAYQSGLDAIRAALATNKGDFWGPSIVVLTAVCRQVN